MTEYEVGDRVRIKTGVFQSFTGRVEAVGPESLLLTVSVEIFGRATPLELAAHEVERIVTPEEWRGGNSLN